MANKKSAASAQAAPKFTVERLGENCRELFGVSASTYAGATNSLTGKFTVEEMRAHIQKWGSKEVK